jgi:hypothetical protein
VKEESKNIRKEDAQQKMKKERKNKNVNRKIPREKVSDTDTIKLRAPLWMLLTCLYLPTGLLAQFNTLTYAGRVKHFTTRFSITDSSLTLHPPPHRPLAATHSLPNFR